MGKNTPRLRSFGAGAGVGVGVGLGVVALGFSVLVGAGFDVLSPDLDAAADAREGAGSAAGLSWETVLSLGETPLEVGLGSSLGKGVFGVVSLAVEALSALAGALSSRLTASLAAVGFAVAFSAAGAVSRTGRVLVVLPGSVLPKSVCPGSAFAASGLTSSVFGASGFTVSVPLASVSDGFGASAFSAVTALSACGGVCSAVVLSASLLLTVFLGFATPYAFRF